MPLRPAVFLDKDGTLVEDVPFNVDPALVRLTRDAGEGLGRLQRAGFALVVVSNQPGIGLGRFPASSLDAIDARLRELFAPYGVTIDGSYYCPHAPAFADGREVPSCACRKPSPGLLLRAARDHRLDLRRSWMVGDILNDIEAGRAAGCRTILLDPGGETEWRRSPTRDPDFRVSTLLEAAEVIERAGTLVAENLAGGA